MDTFSSLREEQEEFEKDLQNVCFICNDNREEIEKHYLGKDGFNLHLKDHDVAAYLCFIFYIKDKAEDEYTGFESYIKEMIEIEDINWLPIERSYVAEFKN